MNTHHDLEQIQRQTGLGETYPQSFVGRDNAALWMEAGAGTRQLAIVAKPGEPMLERFVGKQHEVPGATR